ncbi:MAG: hypothetical protein MSIBF_06340 [Candidatus Altiarchaeales archaeon IMC4]|nr:MAG: hypothetical protein MSIBF_06340 [Candidatus Altiarchaeales archaeon IMC4]
MPENTIIMTAAIIAIPLMMSMRKHETSFMIEVIVAISVLLMLRGGMMLRGDNGFTLHTL